MDAFLTLGDDRLDALQVRTLGRPVSGAARAVLLASEHDGWDAIRHVLLGCLVDEHFGVARDVQGGGTCLAGHFVDESDVGEGAAHHDFVVAASGAVGVVVLGFDALLFQEFAGWRADCDVACGTDVVGGN